MGKIVLIHGEDKDKSFAKLQEYVDRARSKNFVIEKVTSETPLNLLINNKDLFGTKKVILIDEIKLLSKTDLKVFLENKEDSGLSYLIYYAGDIPATILKLLPKPDKIEHFALPKLLWVFFESFFPGNSKTCFDLFQKLTKSEVPELVVVLLMRHLKELFTVKNSKSGSTNIPSWRFEKLQKQAMKFKNGSLEKIIEDIAKIDVAVKTSDTNLKDSLDLLILEKLA